jgi:glutathione reductase (NADPH)
MESTSNHYDLITIGAGSGGVASSRWAAAKYNKKVLIVEQKRVGGTCVNVGCVPKKVMWMAANFLEEAEFMHHYGIETTTKLDFAKLVANREVFIKRLNNSYLKVLKDNKVELQYGTGKFLNDKTIDVDGKQYTADHILIAVGSEAFMESKITEWSF